MASSLSNRRLYPVDVDVVFIERRMTRELVIMRKVTVCHIYSRQSVAHPPLLLSLFSGEGDMCDDDDSRIHIEILSTVCYTHPHS